MSDEKMNFKIVISDTEEGDYGMTDDMVLNIVMMMEAVGFNISPYSVLHNYCAWANGYDSGYGDVDNDYFLFTPEEGDLSFRASHIGPDDDCAPFIGCCL